VGGFIDIRLRGNRNMDKKLRKLKEMVQQRSADVIIGKKGVYEGIINEIKRRLEQKGIIKVKLLKSCIAVEGKDRKELAKYIAQLVNAQLLDIRGRTFVLYKPKEKIRSKHRSKENKFFM